MSGAAHRAQLEVSSPPNNVRMASAMTIPAAMPFVRKYEETRQPHGAGWSVLYVTLGGEPLDRSIVGAAWGPDDDFGVRSTASHDVPGSVSRQIPPPSPRWVAPSGSRLAWSAPLYQRFGLVPCSTDR